MFRSRKIKKRKNGREAPPESAENREIDAIDRSISKFLSLILRHQPDRFGLQIDNRGFVPITDLLEAIRVKKPWVTEDDIRRIAESSEKQRFEIDGSRIRARYGHSIPVSFDEDEEEPPEYLYHGTTPSSLDSIRKHGLQSRDRQYVHLSVDEEEANQVGLRHDPDPVVLTIRALEANRDGYTFYRTGPLFMTREIPPQYIIFPDLP